MVFQNNVLKVDEEMACEDSKNPSCQGSEMKHMIWKNEMRNENEII